MDETRPDSAVEYKILVPLNPGTHSRALLALRLSGEARQPVVLLPIPQAVLDDPEDFSRLEKETARAAQLDHPGILKVYGLQQTSVGLCRAVEYAHGETLRSLLNQAGRIPAPIAARLLCDVAGGVHYAHLAGNEDGSPLVHGDLRPETIMVSLDGTAKISGYGALSVAPREPEGGRRVVGRRKYTAPEQVIGGRSAMAPPTDVFLLGVTLYEMLTGEVPFQSSENPEGAVLAQAIQVNRPEIPEAVRPVITKATAKMSRDRYESALDFRLALDDSMDGAVADDDQVQNWLLPLFASDPRQAELSQEIALAMEDPSKIAPYQRPESIPPHPIAPPTPVAAPQAPAIPVMPQVPAAAPVPAAVSVPTEQSNASSVAAVPSVAPTQAQPAAAVAATVDAGAIGGAQPMPPQVGISPQAALSEVPPSAQASQAPSPAQAVPAVTAVQQPSGAVAPVPPPAPTASQAPTMVPAPAPSVTVQGGQQLPPGVQAAVAQAAMSQLPTQPPLPVQIQLTLPPEALPQVKAQGGGHSKAGWVVAGLLVVLIAFMGYNQMNGGAQKPAASAAGFQAAQEASGPKASPAGEGHAADSLQAEADAPDADRKVPDSPDGEADSPAAPPQDAPQDAQEQVQEAAVSEEEEAQPASRRDARNHGKSALKRRHGKHSPGKAASPASVRATEDDEDEDDEEEDEEASPSSVPATSTGAAQAASPAQAQKTAAPTKDVPAKKQDADDLEDDLEAALNSASKMELQTDARGKMLKKDASGNVIEDAAPEVEKPGLHLFTIPQVNARIKGGKVLGRTPLKVALQPGTYVLELYDADNRIKTERMVKVRDGGPTKMDVTLGIGGIYVTAPDGASVIVDGKRWGIAPLGKAIELYEGHHTLRVQTSDDHWDKSFELSPNDMININLGSGNGRR